MTEESTDEALMLAYVSGDLASFERLFQRHRRPLFTYLLHSTGGRQVAEDLFQEIFLRLIRGKARYRSSGSFRGWLFTIAHSVVTDHRRRSGVREAQSTENAMTDTETSPEPSQGASSFEPRSTEAAVDPVATAHAADLRRCIEAALLHLPAEQREVFLMRERGGLEFQRIAEVTGAGLATVKSRMRYALAQLRRRLSDDLSSVAECLHE